MNANAKRVGFIAILCVLVLGIAVLAIYTIQRGPMFNPNSGIEVLSTADGKLTIKDLYEGEKTIPKYDDVKISTYETEKFTFNENGIAAYDGNSVIGINVSERTGDVDWAKVKESGVDFVMIRVGNRGYGNGTRYIDKNFETNIQGANEAGIDVGVYYYSQAVSVAEAEEEAVDVLSQIQGYQVTYPIGYVWEFVKNPQDGVTPRTQNCEPFEVTSFAEAFCKKIKMSGFKPMVFMDKNMGYDYYNLQTLKDYDIWYSEYRTAPVFYYDYKMWQYTSEGTVPGIEGNVRMNIMLK